MIDDGQPSDDGQNAVVGHLCSSGQDVAPKRKRQKVEPSEFYVKVTGVPAPPRLRPSVCPALVSSGGTREGWWPAAGFRQRALILCLLSVSSGRSWHHLNGDFPQALRTRSGPPRSGGSFPLGSERFGLYCPKLKLKLYSFFACQYPYQSSDI